MASDDKEHTAKTGGGDARKARLAEALRANLRRRREQTRRRAAGSEAPAGDAVNPPQSPVKRD